MHDLTFAKEIISVLNDKLKSLDKGARITAVNTSLSLLSHVKPETLKETFAVMVKDTPLENITLNIAPLKPGINCLACKSRFFISEPTLACPKCHSPDLELVYSKELQIDSVSMEAEKRTTLKKSKTTAKKHGK